jgi:ATP-binding cassette subfamily B (MDR/TAP) protein 1
MTTIAPQIITLTKAASSAEELFKTIDRKSEIDPLNEEGQIPAACTGSIEIENVDFSYPARPDIKVLKGLTLSAPANKTTALVGASGSGKSTIIGLIGLSTFGNSQLLLTHIRTMVRPTYWNHIP